MDSPRLAVFDPTSGGNRSQMLLFGGGGGNTVLGAIEKQRSKRPFFMSAADELLEEYYDDQMMLDKKRRLTPEQVVMLERSFEEESKLEPERKEELARRLGMAPRQVAVWFQNRRARWKTKQLEQEFGRLKSSYDALLAQRETLAKENDRLRSQVISLTEQLQGHEPASPRMSVAALVPELALASAAATSSGAAGAAAKLKKKDWLFGGDIDSDIILMGAEMDSDDASHRMQHENNSSPTGSEDCSLFPNPERLLVAAATASEYGGGYIMGDDEATQIGNWWLWG